MFICYLIHSFLFFILLFFLFWRMSLIFSKLQLSWSFHSSYPIPFSFINPSYNSDFILSTQCNYFYAFLLPWSFSLVSDLHRFRVNVFFVSHTLFKCIKLIFFHIPNSYFHRINTQPFPLLSTSTNSSQQTTHCYKQLQVYPAFLNSFLSSSIKLWPKESLHLLALFFHQ